jgi:hypothetical protein
MSTGHYDLVGRPEYGIREGSQEHRQAIELAEKWREHGQRPPWSVRGQYPAEVRALAEDLAVE